MSTIKNLDSTAIYAYTTLMSVLICVPAALIAEGSRLPAGIDAALTKDPNFYFSLFMVGLLYHLYNQVRRPQNPIRPSCPSQGPQSLLVAHHGWPAVRPRELRLAVSVRLAAPNAQPGAREASRLPVAVRSPPCLRERAAAPLTPRARAPVRLQHTVAREPGLARRVQRGQACGHHRHLGRLLRHYAHQQDQAGCAPAPRCLLVCPALTRAFPRPRSERPGRSKQHWLADTGVEPLTSRSGWLIQACDSR